MNITAFAPLPNVSTVALKAAVAPKNQSLTETPADSFTPSSVAERSGATIIAFGETFPFVQPEALIGQLAKWGKLLLSEEVTQKVDTSIIGKLTRDAMGLQRAIEELNGKGVTFYKLPKRLTTKNMKRGHCIHLHRLMT